MLRSRSLLLILLLLAPALASRALAKDIETDDVTIAAGHKQARAAYVPWSGVWWPFADCELAKGWNGTPDDFAYVATSKTWERRNANKAANDLSPLLKYDLYVKKTTGSDPGSALSELNGSHDVFGDVKDKYDRDGVSYGWWGHCNGWCAAALMEKEPIGPIEAQGIRFDVADLKGLLTESWWSCQSDFTGKRYNLPAQAMTDARAEGLALTAKLASGTPAPVGSYCSWYERSYGTTMSAAAKAAAKPADFKTKLDGFETWFKDNYDAAYADVKPEVFHKILETVIGRKKLAFVCDVSTNEEVWNHPAFSYDTEITFSRDFTEAGKALKEWTVATTVWYATDGVSESIIGVSDFTRDYTYTLVTDAAGKLVRGQWTGDSVDDHPDFCWLPIANPLAADTGENKNLVYGKLLEIVPKAHATSDARVFGLRANGTTAASVRPVDRPTTWSQPLGVQPNVDVSFDVAILTSNSSVAKVKYCDEAVNGGNWNGNDVTASRSGVTALGESTTAPFAVKAKFTSNGKKMIVAYAYDAAGRLLAQDEITLSVGGTGTGNALKEDPYEPNDVRAQATPVNAGTLADLTCNNEDWFKVTLTAAGDLDASIAFKHADGDLDLELVDATGKSLAKSEGTSDSEVCSQKKLAAGSYFVRVHPYQGARAKYSLTVKVAAPAPTSNDDTYEQNDTQATAAAINAGTYANLQCQDDDWFKVTVGATGKLDARIDFKHATGDLDFELVNAQGVSLAKSDSTADREAVSKTGLPAGTYYLHVYGYQGAKGAYALTVSN